MSSRLVRRAPHSSGRRLSLFRRFLRRKSDVFDFFIRYYFGELNLIYAYARYHEEHTLANNQPRRTINKYYRFINILLQESPLRPLVTLVPYCHPGALATAATAREQKKWATYAFAQHCLQHVGGPEFLLARSPADAFSRTGNGARKRNRDGAPRGKKIQRCGGVVNAAGGPQGVRSGHFFDAMRHPRDAPRRGVLHDNAFVNTPHHLGFGFVKRRSGGGLVTVLDRHLDSLDRRADAAQARPVDHRASLRAANAFLR